MALESTSLNSRTGYQPTPTIQQDNTNRGKHVLNDNKGFWTNLWEDVEDYFTGKHSQERDYLYDKKKMEWQAAFEKEMWEKTNAYNSPAQQLARWRAAGGNANAFFGGGTNTGNASMASAPSGGGAAGSTIGVLQGAVNTTAAGLKAWWEARKTKAEAEGKEMENGTYMRRTEAEINFVLAQTDKAVKDGKLSEEQANQIRELLPGLKGKNNAEIDEIRQRTLNLIEENDFIKERTKNLKEDTKGKILDNEKKRWEKLFRDQYGVDPSSGPIQMLIQNILTGKGENVLNAILEYMGGDTDEIPFPTTKEAWDAGKGWWKKKGWKLINGNSKSHSFRWEPNTKSHSFRWEPNTKSHSYKW